MLGCNHLGNRCFIECDKVKRAFIPPRKEPAPDSIRGTFVTGTVAAEITKNIRDNPPGRRFTGRCSQLAV